MTDELLMTIFSSALVVTGILFGLLTLVITMYELAIKKILVESVKRLRPVLIFLMIMIVLGCVESLLVFLHLRCGFNYGAIITPLFYGIISAPIVAVAFFAYQYFGDKIGRLFRK